MNFAIAGLPSKALYELTKSTTSNSMASVRQFSLLPNKTSTLILPIGSQDNPGTMPWKVVLVGSSMFMVMPNLSMVSLYMMLMLLPSSISTFEKFTLISGPMNVGSKTRAYPPGVGMILG